MKSQKGFDCSNVTKFNKYNMNDSFLRGINPVRRRNRTCKLIVESRDQFKVSDGMTIIHFLKSVSVERSSGFLNDLAKSYGSGC